MAKKSKNRRLIGFALAVAGGVMLYFAYEHYNSFTGVLARAFANTPPETFYYLLIPGIILTITGLGLCLRR